MRQKFLSVIKINRYASFEFIVLQVMSDTGRIFFSNIYYPGCSNKHKHTHSIFLFDFEDLIESLLSNKSKRVLLRDFNVHMEKVRGLNARGSSVCYMSMNYHRMSKSPRIETEEF